MSEVELFQRLGLALAVGPLIGLERGWREREAAEGSRVAGIRTFAGFWRLNFRFTGAAVWARVRPPARHGCGAGQQSRELARPS